MKEISDSLCEKGWTLTTGSPTASLMTLQKHSKHVVMSITLMPDSDGVQLHRLRATPEFCGGGKLALSELCEAADEAETTLTLKVRPFGSQALSEAALEKLYVRHGFESDPYASDYSAMIRYPAAPRHEADLTF